MESCILILSEVVIMSTALSLFVWLFMNIKMLFLLHARFRLFGITLLMKECIAKLEYAGSMKYNIVAVYIGKKEIRLSDRIRLYYQRALVSTWCPCAILIIRKKVRVILPICSDALEDIEKSYIRASRIAVVLSIILEVIHVYV